MDRIDQTLATAATNNTYLPSVRAAAALGKNLLNNYYNLTDTTEVYRIAMSTSTKFMIILSHILDSTSPRSQDDVLQACRVASRTGSRQPSRLFAMNLIAHMLSSTAISTMDNQQRHVLISNCSRQFSYQRANLFRGATAWHGIESFLKIECHSFYVMDAVFMVVGGQHFV